MSKDKVKVNRVIVPALDLDITERVQVLVEHWQMDPQLGRWVQTEGAEDSK